MHPAVIEHRDAINELCRQHHVRRLDVFGSATTDGFDPQRSDVDFFVEFEPAGHEDPWTYFRLQRALTELLGRKVDLVEPAGVRNADYQRGIDATRQPFYAAA